MPQAKGNSDNTEETEYRTLSFQVPKEKKIAIDVAARRQEMSINQFLQMKVRECDWFVEIED